MNKVQCDHQSPEMPICEQTALASGQCYWHQHNLKKDPNLRQLLEDQSKHQVVMEGYSLRGADLSGINLVRLGHKEGYRLLNCDMYKADLSGAHLFSIDLSNSSLMKANLQHANLHFADLSNCNLLGTKFEGAKLDNVVWGDHILQERQAEEVTSLEAKQDYYQQAEEIYRNLRKTYESSGLFEQAGYFFEHEMRMRRYQMPLRSVKRILSTTVDLFCGYGERPLRVIMFSMLAVLCFSLAFFLLGLESADGPIVIDFQQSLWSNIKHFLECLYFSVVTFTTLGYGDITPMPAARPVAALEAFLGSFTLALFVVVFVKKMTR